MKTAFKLFTLLACVLTLGIATEARAEEQDGFPVQKQIDSRVIHATHQFCNGPCVEAVEETMPTVYFANASDKLSPAAMNAVKKVAAILKSPAYRHRHVLVSGFTDSKGKAASNQRLSYHRAVMVVKQLEKLGVPAAQLTAQGFGAEMPAATNATSAGRALNRRVTFTVNDHQEHQW